MACAQLEWDTFADSWFKFFTPRGSVRIHIVFVFQKRSVWPIFGEPFPDGFSPFDYEWSLVIIIGIYFTQTGMNV